MRIAILSDLHFGDPMCALTVTGGPEAYDSNPVYAQFKSAVGSDLDYLVLLGDVFDFTVATYGEAYCAAKPFFQRIASDGTLKHVDGRPAASIIYIPGNHDFDVWHQVEYEVNVIRRMHAGKPPRSFRWAVPGVFDLRRGARSAAFAMPHVQPGTAGPEYGGLFLDSLCVPDGATTADARFPFCVAYPNLYLITDEFTALITHGQYFDGYWSFLGEAAPLIAERDLETADPLTIRQLVALNLPLTQLACSGIGQAGPLTSVVRRVQRDVKEGRFDRLERYLERLDNEVLDKLADYGRADPREWISDLLIGLGKSKFLSALKGGKGARYDTEFLQDAVSRRRFLAYLRACQTELEELSGDFGYTEHSAVHGISRVLYGHTHVPIPWGDWSGNINVPGGDVRCSNLGGWLYSERTDTGGVLEGVEIALIESGDIRSIHVA